MSAAFDRIPSGEPERLPCGDDPWGTPQHRETPNPGAKFVEPVPSGPSDLTAYCLLLQGVIGTLLRDKCPEGIAFTTAQLDAFRRNEGPAFTPIATDGGVTIFKPIIPATQGT